MAKKNIDKGEYDYEGDMAMSQLKSIMANSKRMYDMLEPDSNLPEWVQSKITLAEDYIVTAANYMEGSMNEETNPSTSGQKFDMKGRVQEKGPKKNDANKERIKEKSAVVAKKALDIAKGKKNKIDVKPELHGDNHAKV